MPDLRGVLCGEGVQGGVLRSGNGTEMELTAAGTRAGCSKETIKIRQLQPEQQQTAATDLPLQRSPIATVAGSTEVTAWGRSISVEEYRPMSWRYGLCGAPFLCGRMLENSTAFSWNPRVCGTNRMSMDSGQMSVAVLSHR